MQAEIICIGTELTQGHIVNTNAGYLSKELTALGLDVFYHTAVDDDTARLFTVIKRAMHRSDIVITAGGLGPTVDDLTLEIIAQATQKRLILEHNLVREIKQHFHRRHLPMPKDNIRQALIPAGAKTLKNEVGTAPGLIIPLEKKVLIALPGVPEELRPMMKRNVIPYLVKNFPGKKVIVFRTIKTTGLSESGVNQKLKSLLKVNAPLSTGIYAHPTSVDLRITARAKNVSQAEKLIRPLEKKIRAVLKEDIYGYDHQTLEQVVGLMLTKSKKTLAVAESCTGGLIAKRLTDVSGSSKYLSLGLVAYSNQSKQSLLGVPKKMLKRSGAVSKEVARLMAQNIKELAKTDLGLGLTGIAGPSGGSKSKPVGLVYIALATPHKLDCRQFYFHGKRENIRLRASQAALDMLRRYLI